MDVGSYVFFSLPARAVRFGILKTIQREMTGNASPSFIHRVPGVLSSRERIIRWSKIGGRER